MTELTSKSRSTVIILVIIMTSLMLGFHYETIIQGIFPDYAIDPSENFKQCRPASFKDYVGTYHELK